jgi:hypothetical protein
MHDRCSVIERTSLPFNLEGAAPSAPPNEEEMDARQGTADPYFTVNSQDFAVRPPHNVTV